MNPRQLLAELARFPWRSTALTLRERFREDRLGLSASSLTFTTTIPETRMTDPAVETGTVDGGTGALAGFAGTIELHYTVNADGSPATGTYIVNLTRST